MTQTLPSGSPPSWELEPEGRHLALPPCQDAGTSRSLGRLWEGATRHLSSSSDVPGPFCWMCIPLLHLLICKCSISMSVSTHPIIHLAWQVGGPPTGHLSGRKVDGSRDPLRQVPRGWPLNAALWTGPKRGTPKTRGRDSRVCLAFHALNFAHLDDATNDSLISKNDG